MLVRLFLSKSHFLMNEPDISSILELTPDSESEWTQLGEFIDGEKAVELSVWSVSLGMMRGHYY